MTEWMNYNNLNNIYKNRVSNTDIWTKENCKMKVTGDGTVLYLSRRSSVFLFKKNILSTFEKNMILQQKNMLTTWKHSK